MNRRLARLGAGSLAAAMAVVWLNSSSGGASVPAAAPGATPLTKVQAREQFAKNLIAHGRARFATSSMQQALHAMAGELPGGPDGLAPEAGPAKGASAAAGVAAARTGISNVRVNDPEADRFQPDQTTQSETSIAVSGKNVAVGFNDSQQALIRLTNGADLSGYAYSTDGGRSFIDGGTVPNLPNFINLGDPWLASDRAGQMYYSTLALGGNSFNLEVGVSRSGNGGKTWSAPTLVSPNDANLFYSGDKEAITVGRDPVIAGQDNVYAAWDDFVFDPTAGSFFAGLPVSRSTDGGRTWTLTYADKITSDPNTCSFGQYIGAQPLVDPANGKLYVAAERLGVDDPTCSGGTFVASQVIFISTDGGQSFGPGVTISTVTPVRPNGVIDLGGGRFIRTIEFPVLALNGGKIWVAWNDGTGGSSHIMLAQSKDAATWATAAATSGSGDEIQPALAADAKGLHLAYYQRNGDNTLDVVAADSTNGTDFTTRRITTRSFPGVVNVPQFDPFIASGYMGDYISTVTDGTTQYFAWGDNRDIVTNFLHPAGRNDPDVFFARR